MVNQSNAKQKNAGKRVRASRVRKLTSAVRFPSECVCTEGYIMRAKGYACVELRYLRVGLRVWLQELVIIHGLLCSIFAI